MRPLSRRSFLALSVALPVAAAAGPAPPLASKVKPFLIGRCINIEPVLIDPAALVFKVNEGAVAEITAVRGHGIGFGATRDYPTLAELGSAPLDVDEYATCLTEGAFRMGSRAEFPIQCDAATDPTDTCGLYAIEPQPETEGA